MWPVYESASSMRAIKNVLLGDAFHPPKSLRQRRMIGQAFSRSEKRFSHASHGLFCLHRNFSLVV